VETEVLNELQTGKQFYHNLTATDCRTLNDLKSNQDIVIKEADKGSVVMDKDRYILEGLHQLEDQSTYIVPRNSILTQPPNYKPNSES
jgi:hypothetical protein